MKVKLTKRIGALLLVCMMLVVSTSTAFAATNSSVSSGNVSVSSGETVTVTIGTLSTSHSSTVSIDVDGFYLFSRPTIHWRVYKGGEPAFMSGDTYVGDTFSSSNHSLKAGTYYIEITNNSSYSVTVNTTISW